MAQTNLIGKNILGYTVSEKLGSGAFGTVYKVVKTNAAGQYVRALKHITIPTEKQYNSVLNSMGGDVSKADSYFSQMLNNIVSEIRILNDLSEKGVQHIVRYYENDIVVTDTPRRYDIFILMEYLTPLDDYIQSKNFLVRDVIRLGLDVLYGLQSCHNNGVIHRDIKDDNIFVSEKGEYKIGDFGVSKVLKDSSKAESLKGTPNFLAPEVYLGKESYTKSVDLYSLGIVLYRLLNYSRNPFLPRFPEQYFSQDEDAAFEERMSGKAPELPSLGGEAIGRVIVKAISNSSERFQAADEFIYALKQAVDGTPFEILNKKIAFEANAYAGQDIEVSAKQYSATQKETVPPFLSEDKLGNEQNLSLNRIFFSGLTEDYNTNTSKTEMEKERTEDTTANAPESEFVEEHTEEESTTFVVEETTENQNGDETKSPRKVSKYTLPVICVCILILCIGFISKNSNPKNNTDSANSVENSEHINDPADTDSIEKLDGNNKDDLNIQDLVWSGWTDQLPDFVYDDSYIVESKLQYRSAPRYDFFGSETLTDEYTVCYTDYSEWAEEWSDWSTTQVEPSDLVQVETGTRYWYQNYVMWPTVTWGVYEKRTTDKTYSDNVPLKESNTRERLKGWEQTIYRYKSRLKIYFCVKDSEWSDFQDKMIQTSSTTVVNTRTLYRYAKKLGNEAMIPSMDNFPSIAQPIASRFVDVPDNSWYGANKGNWIGMVVDLRVMSANEYQQFRPDGTLTIAELIKTAVSIRKLYNGDNTAVPTAKPWYGPYVDYAIEMNIIDRGLFADYTKPATRAEAALILSRILPDDEYGKRNTVRAITDVDVHSKAFDSIWRLAESGVISWPNPEGTFDPDRNITRAEIAAMICRIVYPELRA